MQPQGSCTSVSLGWSQAWINEDGGKVAKLEALEQGSNCFIMVEKEKWNRSYLVGRVCWECSGGETNVRVMSLKLEIEGV